MPVVIFVFYYEPIDAVGVSILGYEFILEIEQSLRDKSMFGIG